MKSKRDKLDSALLQRKRQYFAKPGMVCTVSYCQAWEDGSHVGFDKAVEMVLELTKTNAFRFDDLQTLNYFVEKIKKLGEG